MSKITMQNVPAFLEIKAKITSAKPSDFAKASGFLATLTPQPAKLGPDELQTSSKRSQLLAQKETCRRNGSKEAAMALAKLAYDMAKNKMWSEAKETLAEAKHVASLFQGGPGVMPFKQFKVEQAQLYNELNDQTAAIVRLMDAELQQSALEAAGKDHFDLALQACDLITNGVRRLETSQKLVIISQHLLVESFEEAIIHSGHGVRMQ